MKSQIQQEMVNVLGTVAVIAGMVGPKVAQGIAKATGRAMTSKGQTVGYQKNFADSKGNWNLRIDATTYGNAKYHHNPHYHVGDRGGKGTSIRTIWETIKGWFGPNK